MQHQLKLINRVLAISLSLVMLSSSVTYLHASPLSTDTISTDSISSDSVSLSDNESSESSDTVVSSESISSDTSSIPEVSGQETSESQFNWDGNEISGFTGSTTDIVIPSRCTAIKPDAFQYKSNIETVIIPSTVITIGSRAFSGCSSLTTVTLTDGLTGIASDAFENCTSLKSIALPSTLATNDSQDAFADSSIETVTFSSSITSIPSYIFRNCKTLKSVEIPSKVTAIGNSAFKGCTSLSTVTFGTSSQLTTIWYNAFDSCTSLTSIELPMGTTTVDPESFYNCTSLTSITMPYTIKYIGYGTIWDTESLFIGSSNVTIKGYTGSDVETYAKHFSLKFVSIGSAPSNIPAKSVTINKTKLTISPNSTYQLKLSFTPSNASTLVSWYSDNPNVAIVSTSGLVQALEEGTANITVTTDSSKTAKCTVVVKYGASSGAEDSKYTLVVKQKVSIASDYITEHTRLKYKSSSSSIAAVNSRGIVTGKHAGEAVITVYSYETGISEEVGSVTIEVEKPTFSSLKGLINTYPISLNNIVSNTSIVPTWYIRPNRVISLSDDNITMQVKQRGSGKVVAIFGDGSMAARYSIPVSVVIPTLNKSTIRLVPGQSSLLRVRRTQLQPTWSSESSNIVTINNGYITAVNAGTSVITASFPGVECRCTVIVSSPVISKAVMRIKSGHTSRIRLNRSRLSTVNWESSDKKVATVDGMGYITALSPGTATISTNAAGVQNSCIVYVY